MRERRGMCFPFFFTYPVKQPEGYKLGWKYLGESTWVGVGRQWKGNNEQACLWGTNNEKNAIKDYMVRTGNVVRAAGFFEHPKHPWLGGSPDGLVGERGMIEVASAPLSRRSHT